MFIVFVPFTLGLIGFAVASIIMTAIAVLVFFIALGYSYYAYKYKLADWPRWVTLSEHLDEEN